MRKRQPNTLASRRPSPFVQPGFTLIELLIVIGIIGFLAAAVLVAVDPVKRIQDTRDARRYSEANGLLNAILNKQNDTAALFPGDKTSGEAAPIVESATLAQVIVREAAGIDCAIAASRPLCTQLPAGFSLDTGGGAGVNCVARLDRTTGVPTPSVTATLVAGAGNVTSGTHTWIITFVTNGGETGGGPTSNQLTTNTATNGKVNLTGIPIGPVGAGVIARKVYRTAAGNLGDYKLVGTVNDNSTTTFQDDVADGSLGATLPTSNTTGLVPQYIASLPIDPGTSASLSGNLPLGDTNTGYYIIRNPTSKRIIIGACYGEQRTDIRVQR